MSLTKFGQFTKQNLFLVWNIVVELFKKYQRDNANIIVSSISFYILLTFIPFTLLSIYILGHVIDISNPGIHVEKFLRNILPDPYNTIIVKKVIKELNVISVTKKLSGPLGLIFLFFFTTKLFSVIRPSFRLIFGKHPERFLRAKEKELFFAFIFSIIQAMLFFSFIFSVVIRTKVVGVLPVFLSKAPVAFIFSVLDMMLTFAMFYFLYYFLTPVRKSKRIVILAGAIGTLFWHLGKSFFKYYILHLGKFTAFFGAYGVSIIFLFWVYFSVFVFISCAELESILLQRLTPVRRSDSEGGTPLTTTAKTVV
ncbi:MAG: YihY/virulence factor BrkB family protein [Proteobacteria bacterium]|nr:YihY/virulence factor BrkB family protein [Pseudomonadota bacterium]